MSALTQPRRAANIDTMPGMAFINDLRAMIRAEVQAEFDRRGPAQIFTMTVREYRLRAGHTVAELCLLAGVSESWYRDLENGVIKSPHMACVDKLARALKVDESTYRQHVGAELSRRRREESR